MDTLNFIKFYDLEKYILTNVRENFNRDEFLTSFDFFCIIIWKANRAKSRIAKRLLTHNPDMDLEKNVETLTSMIFRATDDKQKLKILIDDYKFRLPMSSAILTLLYPDNFTVYDVRVCDTLKDFKGIDSITDFEKLWPNYEKYVESIKEYEPKTLSLRDKDKFLWGKSFYDQLTDDLKNGFKK